MTSSAARAAMVIALLAGTAVLERAVSGAEATVARATLDTVPLALEGWHGRPAAPLAKDVVAELGVDDHVYRTYEREGVAVSFYAGYYNSQRRGDAIHSPQNCLPGAGWQPIESSVVDVAGPGGNVRVNQYVIQKGLQKQLVLYWYQGRGRVIANEYANKAYLMWDAATQRRTGGGLVRIITPVTSTTEAASRHAAEFAAVLLPQLKKVMP